MLLCNAMAQRNLHVTPDRTFDVKENHSNGKTTAKQFTLRARTRSKMPFVSVTRGLAIRDDVFVVLPNECNVRISAGKMGCLPLW